MAEALGGSSAEYEFGSDHLLANLLSWKFPDPGQSKHHSLARSLLLLLIFAFTLSLGFDVIERSVNVTLENAVTSPACPGYFKVT